MEDRIDKIALFDEEDRLLGWSCRMTIYERDLIAPDPQVVPGPKRYMTVQKWIYNRHVVFWWFRPFEDYTSS